MIIKIPIYLIFFITLQTITSQTKEVCEDPAEESLIDLNSITAKCTIKTVKDSSNKDQVQIQVSSRKRIVRKRAIVKGVNTQNKDIELSSIKGNTSMVGSLDLSKESVAEKLPFENVEEIPLFKSCEKVSLIKVKECFNKKMAEHIIKNFTYPLKAQNENIQGRVLTQFVINQEGNVIDINLRGPYKGELLEEEAKRIINKLPKFKPGKHNGQAVKVKYGIPINFKIPGKAPSNIKENVIITGKTFSFKTVNKIPNFKSCSKSNNNENCFNNQLVKHINNHFIYPEEAVNKNIEGKVIVYFVIDKNGNIANIKTRAPKGCEIIEKVTKNIFEKLPKFSPAMNEGKAVNVKHIFPIDFKL